MHTTSTHNRSYLLFRQQLVRKLIGDHNSRIRRSIIHAVIHHDLVCNAKHFPSNLGSDKHGLCKLSGCRRQAVWYCATCHMCLRHTGKEDDCLAKHHAIGTIFFRHPHHRKLSHLVSGLSLSLTTMHRCFSCHFPLTTMHLCFYLC